MKNKLMIAVAIMALAATGLMAGPSVHSGTVTTTWAAAVYTNTVFDSAIVPTGDSGQLFQLDKVVIQNDTASSASVEVQMNDIDGWTTLTGSPVTAAAGLIGTVYPARLVTETSYGWVGTSSAVQSVTNSYLRPVRYNVNKLRLITTLNSTNYPGAVKYTIHYE